MLNLNIGIYFNKDLWAKPFVKFHKYSIKGNMVPGFVLVINCIIFDLLVDYEGNIFL